jgi:hypothetical protein
MVWTYDGNPTTDIEKVRLHIGDTDTTDQQLNDDEVQLMLTNHGSVEQAALGACDLLIAKYSRRPDKSVGALKISASQIRQGYRELKSALRATFGLQWGAIYAGGISVDDKATDQDDTDRVVPAFTREMHEYPGAAADQEA